MSKPPLILNTVEQYRQWQKINLFSDNKTKKTVGFVPTMGFLHQGHASLLSRSVRENDFTVLSIYVNPTQFNQASDLEHYPRDLESDIALAHKEGVDVIFLPDYSVLYPDDYRFKISENIESERLEGAYRPGHFIGVMSVVMKLLQIMQPNRAYFGEKDYQQGCLIRDMANAFFMECEIILCATIREPDGLAMSSRNVRLSESNRQRAALFPQLLSSCLPLSEVESQLAAKGFQVDYVIELSGRRFGAVWLGDVRLIDNVLVN